jgi:hypothetical protein
LSNKARISPKRHFKIVVIIAKLKVFFRESTKYSSLNRLMKFSIPTNLGENNLSIFQSVKENNRLSITGTIKKMNIIISAG